MEFSKINNSGLNPELFERDINGVKSELFVLRNSQGMEVCVTNYGATLVSILAKDKDGKYANVVLGHDSIESIFNSPEPFLSTVIGRYANRIAKGKCILDGQELTLPVNNGPNHLHGGPEGFHAVVWEARQTDEQTLILNHVSPDGHAGFPGEVNVEMVYHLNDNNEFVMDYSATTNKRTILNLTNHAFFNLNGLATPSASIEDNIVEIFADFYTPIDDTSIPTGEIASVKNTPFDFTTPATVGSRIEEENEQLKNGAGYDHNYVLRKNYPGELTKAATCLDPKSGRKLTVLTTEPGVQLYTGNWLNGFAGMHGTTYPARTAICFEAQHFPDTPNKAHFPTAILSPGEEYRQTTIYAFSVEE